MREWLVGLVGESLAPIVAMILAGLLVIALVLIVVSLFKRVAGGGLGLGNRSQMPRLAVLDVAAVDQKRKLVLLRRDEVEHLVMIGGPNDLLIEPHIIRGASNVVGQRRESGTRTEPTLAPLGAGADRGRGPVAVAEPAVRTATAAVPPMVAPRPQAEAPRRPVAVPRVETPSAPQPRQAPSPQVRAEPQFDEPVAVPIPRVDPSIDRMRADAPAPQAPERREDVRPVSRAMPVAAQPQVREAPRMQAQPAVQRSMATPTVALARATPVAAAAVVPDPVLQEPTPQPAPEREMPPVVAPVAPATSSILDPNQTVSTSIPTPILDPSGQPVRQPLSVRSFATAIQNHRVETLPVRATPPSEPAAAMPTAVRAAPVAPAAPRPSEPVDDDGLADLLRAEFDAPHRTEAAEPTSHRPEPVAEPSDPRAGETLEDEMERLLRDFTLDAPRR